MEFEQLLLTTIYWYDAAGAPSEKASDVWKRQVERVLAERDAPRCEQLTLPEMGL